MCEAEELIRRTVFELDMQKTAGIWNPSKVRGLLASLEDCSHNRPENT